MRALFLSNPWVGLLPYTVLYYANWALGISPQTLRSQFLVLHLLMVGIVLRIGVPTLLRFTRAQVFFWGILFLFFAVPGAYLEYPSDAWEHYRRIFLWNGPESISQHYVAQKFSYFWAWSFLSYLPLSLRPWGVSLLSAFTQFLLAIQVLRFVRHFEKDAGWDYLHTFAFFCFFGTSVFGMRYYAISSTPFAYTGYLAFLLFALRWTSGKRDSILLLLGAVLLMGSNHVQTLLFAVIGLFAVGLAAIWEKANRKKQILLLALLFSLFATGIILGWLTRNYYARIFFGEMIDRDLISRFGTFRIWIPQIKLIETWGVHGIIGVALGLIYFQRNVFFLLFSIVPVFTLLFPPLIIIIARSIEFDVPYRLLYAGPTSFVLVAGIKNLLNEQAFKKWLPSRFSLPVVFLAVMALGILYPFPWRGRLFFQLYRPPETRTLKFLRPILTWFEEHPELIKNCVVFSDDLTMFLIHTELTPHVPTNQFARLPPLKMLARRLSIGEFDNELSHRLWKLPTRGCGLLTAIPNRVPKIASSRISGTTRHWPDSAGDFVAASTPRMYEW